VFSRLQIHKLFFVTFLLRPLRRNLLTMPSTDFVRPAAASHLLNRKSEI
jgi:hypothetical protein